MNKLPKARTKNILVQELEKEVMLYDTITDKSYCLNETSSIVFTACNGSSTFEDIKNRYKLTDDIIYLALDGLKKENLLDDSADYASPFAGMRRREVIRKIGLASMIALPLISSLIAPQSSEASSTCLQNKQTCTRSFQCCSSGCYSNVPGAPAGSVCCASISSVTIYSGPGTATFPNFDVCSDAQRFSSSRCCSGTATNVNCTFDGTNTSYNYICT